MTWNIVVPFVPSDCVRGCVAVRAHARRQSPQQQYVVGEARIDSDSCATGLHALVLLVGLALLEVCT